MLRSLCTTFGETQSMSQAECTPPGSRGRFRCVSVCVRACVCVPVHASVSVYVYVCEYAYINTTYMSLFQPPSPSPFPPSLPLPSLPPGDRGNCTCPRGMWFQRGREGQSLCQRKGRTHNVLCSEEGWDLREDLKESEALVPCMNNPKHSVVQEVTITIVL